MKEPSYIVFSVLAIHALLVTWVSFHSSANRNEPAHLAAGVYSVRYGRFDIYRVNPPLSRMVAAIPAEWFLGIEADWLASSQQTLGHRAEFLIGCSLFSRNDPLAVYLALAFGRVMVLPFSLLGAWACYRWANQLFGRASGYLAVTLWCFSPMILAWAATLGPDIASTAVGVAGFYCFWLWCHKPTWGRVFLVGACGGVMLLSKTTWLIIFFVWPTLWSCCIDVGIRHALRELFRQVAQLVTILVLAVAVLNAGYSFIGTGRQLKSFAFVSNVLAGKRVEDGQVGGNRFSSSWAGHIPVMFPEDFIIGVDLQEYDFEQGLPSYLRGEWSEHGWWYYYVYALAIKTPLGTWCLVAFAIGTTLCTYSFSASARDELFLIGPAIVILALVSSQTGFSVHSRYVVPALPFLFVWASKVAQVFQRKSFARNHFPLRAGVVLALVWSVGSSLAVYPHNLSYFNEIVGGPKGGPKHLLGSNVDWDQDLYYLETWYTGHPSARPFNLLYTGTTPIETTSMAVDGIPPECPNENRKRDALRGVVASIDPGWYALSVNALYGRPSGYEYLLRFTPVAMAGYSLYIYRLTREDIDSIRRESDLPPLTTKERSRAEFIGRVSRGRQRDERTIEVGVYGDNGCDQDCVEALKRQLSSGRFLCKTLMSADVRNKPLQDIDVIIFPGGYAPDQWESLGRDGGNAVCEFVRAGGGYLGICAGAFLATSSNENCFGMLNVRCLARERRIPRIGNVKVQSLGGGTVSLSLTASGCAVFGDGAKEIQMLYSGGPIFLPGGHNGLPTSTRLALFQSEVFLYDFQKGTMLGSPAIVAAPYGKGIVLAMSPHPELTRGLQYMIPEVVMTLVSNRSKNAASDRAVFNRPAKASLTPGVP